MPPIPEGRAAAEIGSSVVIDSSDVNIETSGAKSRAVMFIDYQNMYRSAREAFGWESEAGHYGNFKPYNMALTVANRLGCSLCGVRVYTGVHTPNRNPAQHAHMLRRMTSWLLARPGIVEVLPRPLAYRRIDGRWIPTEKGVDVEVAIDLVRLAIDDEFDVAILGSADTDLEPAARYVLQGTGKRVVCVGYQGVDGTDPPQPLDLGHERAGRFYIGRELFDRVVDRTNYYDSRSDQAQLVPQDQWLAVMSRLGRK